MLCILSVESVDGLQPDHAKSFTIELSSAMIDRIKALSQACHDLNVDSIADSDVSGLWSYKPVEVTADSATSFIEQADAMEFYIEWNALEVGKHYFMFKALPKNLGMDQMLRTEEVSIRDLSAGAVVVL